jgi:hypothetical protein
MKDKRDSTSGPPAPVPSSIYSVYSVTFKGNSRASRLNLVSKESLCTHPGDQTWSADGPARGRKSNGFLLTTPSDRESQGDGTVLSEFFSGILPINPCNRALLTDSSIHRQALNGDPSAIPRDPGPPREDSTRGHAYNRSPPIAPPDQRPRARERDLHGPKSIFHVRHAQIPPRPSRRNSSLKGEMHSRFDDTEDGSTIYVREPVFDGASNLIDHGIGRESSDGNPRTSAKKHARSLRGLDLLKLNCMRKTSVRRGKQPARPTTGRPRVSGAHANANADSDPVFPRPSHSAARRVSARAIGEEQHLRGRCPLPRPPVRTRLQGPNPVVRPRRAASAPSTNAEAGLSQPSNSITAINENDNAGPGPHSESKLEVCGMPLTARLREFGPEQYSRTRRPLTPTTSGEGGGESHVAPTGAEVDVEVDAEANIGAFHMPNRRRRLIHKKPEKVGLGHAGQRDLVISQVLAVDCWGIPMRQYPIENGVRWLEGELEHMEELAWMNRKRGRGSDGEATNGGRRRRRSYVDIPTEDDMVEDGHVDGKGKVTRKAEDAGEEETERQEEGDGKLPRGMSLKWDLHVGMSAGRGDRADVEEKLRAGQAKSKVSERKGQIEDNMTTTPLEMVARRQDRKNPVNAVQHSPNDSGYGGSSSNSTSTSRTISNISSTPNGGGTSGTRIYQHSPASTYNRGSPNMNSPPSPSNRPQTNEVECDAEVIRRRVRQSVNDLRAAHLAEAGERLKSTPGLAVENALTERQRRANRDKDMEDQLFAERIQLEQLKERQLSWWEKRESQVQLQSQTRARTSRSVRQGQAVQGPVGRMSRIPTRVPKSTAQPDTDEPMSNTPKVRLSRLKAARKEVFDHARLYEYCAMSLEDRAFSPSTKAQRQETVWPLRTAGGSRRSAAGHRTASSVDFRNILSAADRTRSSLEFDHFSADDKPPPIPKRSPRRVLLHVPFGGEIASIGPPDSSEAEEPSPDLGEKEPAQHGMPPRVYGHWLTLQHELKERLYDRHLSVIGDIGAEIALEQEDAILTPKPLNLGRRRKRRLGDLIMQRLRSRSPSVKAQHWI